ncbi:MAG: glycosyl transferase family 1, partial [Sphingobium sp.]
QAWAAGAVLHFCQAMLGADKIMASDAGHVLAREILSSGIALLLALLERNRKPDWTWFEPVLAYDNCRLPEALICAGLCLGHVDAVRHGIATLEWIVQQQISPAGHFRPVGSDSFGREGDAPQPFDQQPVEIWAVIDAASAAMEATGDTLWIDHACCAYSWFSGNNDRGVVVGDPVTGTCFDGINPRGLNLNQGAESVLAYQLSSWAIQRLLATIETKRQ